MIPDTSGQDTLIATAPTQARPKRLVWVLAAAVGAALIVWLASSWLGSSRSVDVSRIRIAEVSRGTLVRDASVNGRVVAAVSPTMYAPAASTVTLKIHAGDKVKKGDVLAVLDSPDLSNVPGPRAVHAGAAGGAGRAPAHPRREGAPDRAPRRRRGAGGAAGGGTPAARAPKAATRLAPSPRSTTCARRTR
jgi:hypothetical protein